MATPERSLLEVQRDALIAKLKAMSRREGYRLDYGPPEKNSIATFDNDALDYSRPVPHVRWGGTVEPDDRQAGDEDAAGRFRHYERWLISFALSASDGDHEKLAFAVRADVHQRLCSGDRRLGLLYGMSHDVGASYLFGLDGCFLELEYTARWDHASGDMTTEG